VDSSLHGILLRMGQEAPAFALLPGAEEQVDAVVRSVLAGQRPSGMAAQGRLGLGGLPARIDRLAPGMIYGLVCDQQAVRLPLLAGALAVSLRLGKQCVLVTPSEPGVLLRKLNLAGFTLLGPLKTGQLTVFQITADAAKHLFRVGAQGLLTQLQQNIAARDALLVLDQADALFMVSDPLASAEASRLYLEWTARRDHTVIALFSPATDALRDHLVLRRIAENFAGFAQATPAEGGMVLEIQHWFGPDGANSRESFELRR
jgi:hypothetical protein